MPNLCTTKTINFQIRNEFGLNLVGADERKADFGQGSSASVVACSAADPVDAQERVVAGAAVGVEAGRLVLALGSCSPYRDHGLQKNHNS